MNASSRSTPPYDFSQQVGHLLRRAYQRHVSIFQETIPDSRLTGAQLGVLCALNDLGAMSMSEACRVTAIDLATMRGVIERLKARDLVSALPDSVDRRKVIVDVTGAGKALLDETIPAAHLISQRTIEILNPAEQVALQYLLRKLADGTGASTGAAKGTDSAGAPEHTEARARARRSGTRTRSAPKSRNSRSAT